MHQIASIDLSCGGDLSIEQSKRLTELEPLVRDNYTRYIGALAQSNNVCEETWLLGSLCRNPFDSDLFERFLRLTLLQDTLKNNITILDKLSYENWIHVIYSSSQVITPECGCTHISAACKIPVNIIYDADNLPDAIYNEYSPWKSKHKKFVFNEKDLNKKIINCLE